MAGRHTSFYYHRAPVLHLCREIGVPVVWDFNDFAERGRYASLVGFKRVRTLWKRLVGGSRRNSASRHGAGVR